MARRLLALGGDGFQGLNKKDGEVSHEQKKEEIYLNKASATT
jgi:hypothetical protein